MTSTKTACSKPSTCSPRSATTCREPLMLSSALTFQPGEQAGSFDWGLSLKTSTASPAKSTKFVRRDTWLLRHTAEQKYLAGIEGKALELTDSPEEAWTCLSPQRAAQVVSDFTALLGGIDEWQLVPVTLWCRADQYPKGWFCDD